MLVHETEVARSQANIPMHVDAGLSQAIKKANSTTIDMHTLKPEGARSQANIPMHVDAGHFQALIC